MDRCSIAKRERCYCTAVDVPRERAYKVPFKIPWAIDFFQPSQRKGTQVAKTAIALIFLLGAVGGMVDCARADTSAKADKAVEGRGALRAALIDPLDRIYPDRFPTASRAGFVAHLPRGATTCLIFAVQSKETTRCAVEPLPIKSEDGHGLSCSLRLYELLNVHVEANTAGGSRTQKGKSPPKQWMSHFVRRAPFDVAEVLSPCRNVRLKKDRTRGVALEIAVDRDARSGRYRGALRFTTKSAKITVPFALEIHDVVLDEFPPIYCTYWLSVAPRDLTSETPPDWWSKAHWRLVKNTARVLRGYGQNVIFTPLIDLPEALIQVKRRKDGSYGFDYSRFDRWVDIFREAGYVLFEGHHLALMPATWAYGGIFVKDEKTGKTEPLLPAKGWRDTWLKFLPIFLQDFYRHLRQRGLAQDYVQHLLDEPKNLKDYEAYFRLARAFLPGIKTIDAINSRPEVYSPLVDIHVFALTSLAARRDLVHKRRAEGKDVWLYHCCSPYPPMPNRHLDEALTNSRLYPWLTFLLDADGYLYWGANMYRGANPYKTSVGPVPSGSQTPGHPPGDNWFFYPGPEGLLGSVRMVAFREGLVDLALLKMLAKKDGSQAHEIMNGIARSIRDYERDPRAYHAARASLLRALDRIYRGNRDRRSSDDH